MKSVLYIKIWYNDTQQTWSAICWSFVISKKRYANRATCLDGYAYRQIRFFFFFCFFTKFLYSILSRRAKSLLWNRSFQQKSNQSKSQHK